MFDLFDAVPVWGVFIGTVVVVLVAIWIGNRVGRHAAAGVSSEAPVNAVTGAHLGLLAFILAFSFNMASGHFDTRRKLILEEVNVVGTAYFSSQLISDSSVRERLRHLLKEYVEIRASITPGADVTAAIAQSEVIQEEIRRVLEEISHTGSLSSAETLFTRAMNDVVAYHHRRIAAAFHYRIPKSIWPTLYGILVFSMIGLGYTFGLKESSNHVGSIALALSFSFVIFLTADLDRPTSGVLVVDQSPYKQLSDRMSQPSRSVNAWK